MGTTLMVRITAMCLWCLLGLPVWLCCQEIPEAKVGGRISPDGSEEIQVDLPGALHRRNISSGGLGCCVFTSMHHAALWQSTPQWQEFPKWMVDHRVPGGGYPQKVAALSKKISDDRKMPEPDYIQAEGRDLEILKLAHATGRMTCVTYDHSPTGRYGGGHIAHMVNLAHATDKWFAVLDNNYLPSPGRINEPDNYEWMTPAEFGSCYGSGWCIILLNPGPPPVPRN